MIAAFFAVAFGWTNLGFDPAFYRKHYRKAHLRLILGCGFAFGCMIAGAVVIASLSHATLSLF